MTTGFERYSKQTKRALFLEEMEQVVPWSQLCALVIGHKLLNALGGKFVRKVKALPGEA